jgi:hypothetical protein
MAREIYAENSASLYEAYLDATRLPHGYLVLDLALDTDDLLSFRTKIFPEKYSPVLYAPVSDEKDKVELIRSTTA